MGHASAICGGHVYILCQRIGAILLKKQKFRSLSRGISLTFPLRAPAGPTDTLENGMFEYDYENC